MHDQDNFHQQTKRQCQVCSKFTTTTTTDAIHSIVIELDANKISLKKRSASLEGRQAVNHQCWWWRQLKLWSRVRKQHKQQSLIAFKSSKSVCRRERVVGFLVFVNKNSKPKQSSRKSYWQLKKSPSINIYFGGDSEEGEEQLGGRCLPITSSPHTQLTRVHFH